MDFFEHQEVARKKTKFLVWSFVLSVVCIIAAIYFGVAFARILVVENASNMRGAPAPPLLDLGLFLPVAGGTLLVILLGSGYKTMQFSAGGSAVAEELGGKRLDPGTRRPEERKLLNVVEEMAIAAGTPVPVVYLLENEDGINAFAAGRTPSDAVIGVTRGCMQLLTRDELQGVIAHEYSHILNGDMRLNLRMLCLLHGILVVAIIGQMLMRVGFYSRGGSRESKGGGAAIMIAGIAIIVIGYIGVFFGSLIKAAISRQREFLADASAVQFTRNPDGIGGALLKIGGHATGSKIENPHAEEASHMFFAAGLRSAFATHPPLHERIARILPHWKGSYPDVDNAPPISADSMSHAALSGFSAAPSHPSPSPTPQSPQTTTLELGQLNDHHIAAGAALRNGLPENWLEAAQNRSGAQALIFALLLGQDDNLRDAEIQFVRQHTDDATSGAVEALYPELRDIHSAQKLALIDLTIPALKRLSPAEYERFRAILRHLVESDKVVNLFEFTLEKIIQRHLDIHFRHVAAPRIRFQSITQLADETSVLLTTLAMLGAAGNEQAGRDAFEYGASEITRSVPGIALTLMPPEKCGLAQIDEALNRFDEATPLIKKQLLNAAGRAVVSDGKIISDEAELIRAIADTIGTPIPPFVRAT